MRIKLFLATVSALAFLSAGAVHAQTTPAPKTDKTTTTAKPAKAEKKAAKPRTAKSIECSKQADAKGLHGAERRKFREACKKA